jgi:hypothetical protein
MGFFNLLHLAANRKEGLGFGVLQYLLHLFAEHKSPPAIACNKMMG